MAANQINLQVMVDRPTHNVATLVCAWLCALAASLRIQDTLLHHVSVNTEEEMSDDVGASGQRGWNSKVVRRSGGKHGVGPFSDTPRRHMVLRTITTTQVIRWI